MKGGEIMKQILVASIIFVLGVFTVGMVSAQTATPTTSPTTTPTTTTTTTTPSATVTTTPAPTGSVQGAVTVPSGAPATGRAN